MPATATTPKPKRGSVAAIQLPLSEPTGFETATEETPAPLFEVAPEEGEIAYLSNDVLEIWVKNPRLYRDPADVADIAQSVQANNQDDELKVRPKPGFPNRFEIIEGGTRFEGRHLNGRQIWRCRVYKLLSDKAALDMAARSQFKRRDWGALDRANYYRLEREETARSRGHAKPEDVSFRDLGDELGVSHEQVRHYLELLKLPTSEDIAALDLPADMRESWGGEVPDVQLAFAKAKLTEGHGREILKLTGHFERQLELIEWVTKNGKEGKSQLASIEATAKEARRHLEELGIEPKSSTKAKKAEKDAAKLSLDFGDGEPSTRVDTFVVGQFRRGENAVTLRADGTETIKRIKGNPDDSELPKEDDWRSFLRAQHAGVNGVGASAPASEGSGFATAPDAGQTVQPATGQTGTRSINQEITATKALENSIEWVERITKALASSEPLPKEVIERIGGKAVDLKFAVLDLLLQLNLITPEESTSPNGRSLWDASGSIKGAITSLKRYDGKTSLQGGETYVFDFIERDAKTLGAEVRRIKPILKQLEKAE